MDEEKFTNLLRESMELERQLPFQEEGWKALEGRLDLDEASQDWRKWWWVLLLVGFALLYFLQWKELKEVQQNLEQLKEKQLNTNIKIDTIFEKIIIPQYDTIYKTIIKEVPLKLEKQAPKKLNHNEQSNDLSFLKPLKPKPLNQENKEEALAQIKKNIPTLTDNSKLLYRKPSFLLKLNNPLNFYDDNIKKSSVVPFFIEATLGIEQEVPKMEYHQFKKHNPFNKKESIWSNFKKMLDEVESIGIPPPDISTSVPLLLSNIGNNQMVKSDYSKWTSLQRKVSAHIDMAYYFSGKRFQPFVGFYAASDWQQNRMTSTAFYADLPAFPSLSEGLPFDIPDIASFPNATFQTSTEGHHSNLGEASTVRMNQSLSYHQFDIWYELNIGLQYKF